MSQVAITNKRLRFSLAAFIVLILISLFISIFPKSFGAELTSRSVELGDDTISASTIYNFSFVIPRSEQLGSIQFQFCSNDPLIDNTCTLPAGFSASQAAIQTETGISGYTINSHSTVNNLILSGTASTVGSVSVNVVFSNIVNPSSSGSYYVRIQTFASTDATGTNSDYGGLAYAINAAINITATVPPYLLFCTGLSIPNYNCTDATGDYINFGNLSTTSPSYGNSEMLAATNAVSGYTISVYGTTLESGISLISNITKPDVSRPGTSQFGLNLRANSSPNTGTDPIGGGSGTPEQAYDQPNFYTFNSGDIVASNPKPDLDRLYTASYLVNVSPLQQPGVYVSTLTYICVATF